ncbi:MAG: DUF2842 domain-containing protein [Rhodobacteraceae bacterium]|nr:DUF2842 domain-containing protein [Paracoccaceae bacterium]
MALSYKSRKRWSLFVLVIALPLYMVVAVSFADWLREALGGLHVLAELALFVGLGIVWIIPLKQVFKGVGQPDPDAPDKDG